MPLPHYFAPGVVSGGPRARRRRILAALLSWLVVLVLGTVAVIAFLRGGA